jgi:hypothetical protein
MGRRAPQICAEDLLVVCVSFFSRCFFFRRVLGKNNRSLPCFLCASTHASQANEENLSHIPRFRRPLN